MNSARKSSSVAKAFELLQVVAGSGQEGVGLQALAAELGVATSTAHRYIASLIDVGAIERDSDGRYRLGIGLVTLAGQHLEDDVLRTAAHPFLVELADISGETAHLAVPLGNNLVYVDKVESAQSVRLVSRIGSQIPMHCTAMGKVLLSLMSAEERAPRLEEPLARPTGKTRVGEELLAELDRVRDQGYALDDEENETGVRCIGFPIFNAAGSAVAAFSVSAPASRFGVDDCLRLAPSAAEMSAQITKRIGFAGRSTGSVG